MEFLRRFLQVLLLVATLLVGAAAAVIIVSQTAWFKDWLRGLIVRQANQYLNGRLSIGHLGGNIFFGLEFQDLGVTQGGERVIAVRNAGVDYSVIQFVSGDIVIDHIRLDRPVVNLTRDANGWNLGRLVKKQKQEKQRTGPGKPITIGEVGISDGTFVLDRGTEPAGTQVGTSGANGTSAAGASRSASPGLQLPGRIDHIDARFSFRYEPVHYTVDIGHVSLRGHNPNLALNDLSGRISARDKNLYLDDVAIRTAESSLKVNGEVAQYADKPALKIEASSDKFSIPEVGRLVSSLRGIPLQPSFKVKASGRLDQLAFDFAVNSSAGDASGDVTADLVGREHGIKGVVHLKDLDLAPILKTKAAKSDLTGLARVDVRFPAVANGGPVIGSFSVSTFSARLAGYYAEQIEAAGRVSGKRVFVDRGKAIAYGAAATAAGTVEPGVRGPDGKTGLAVDLHGSVAGLDLRRLPATLKVPPFDSRLNLDYQLDGVSAALTGRARLKPSVLGGAQLADGTVGTLSSAGPSSLEYSAEGGIANLDIQRYGRVLKIDALSTDRFASDINGRFSAKGSGTSVAALTLDAKGDLYNSTLDRVSLPLMSIEAHLANGGGRFRANGGFFDLDPSRFTGNAKSKGDVAGRVAVDASLANLTGPITPGSVAASGEVVLDRSNVGGLEIAKARVAGRYANSAGQLDEATVTGPDLSVRASGPFALGDSGASNVAYHVETPDLGAIGKLAGQDALQGFLSLDGHLTGNRANLATQGQLKAGNLHYGANEVLTAQSSYSVTMPNLDAARAQVKADSNLGFLKVGGQDINVLRATTTYGNRKLDFDATAEQSVRSGRFVGSLLLHPNHREVHLTQFGLKTQGMTWSLAPGTAPVVQYGGGDVTVKDVHLVSGPQSLAVAGTLGKSSNLRAALTDVDLAHVDTWVTGDRRLGGILNAAATVTGPASDPNVSGDFSVDRGAFREFQYDTLGGNVTYAKDRLALDVRLEQNPQAWLIAKGTVPTALFRSPTTPSGAPAPGSDAPVDVTVRSSPVDIGVVQGFTSAITKASGTFIADAHLGGTAATPQMSGYLQFTNGAFTVAPAGVGYKALNGRVDLQPGRAVINQLSVTDEHGRNLAVSGELGLHGRSFGALKLQVRSNKFEVLHNDLGRVTLNSDVAVGGEMRAPDVKGEIAVNTATIDIDRVLELFTTSAYSTKPESTGVATGETTASGAPVAGTTNAAAPVGTAGRGQTNPAGAPEAPAPSAPAAQGSANAAQGAGGVARGSGGVARGSALATSTRAASAAANQRAQQQQARASVGPFDAATINVTVKVPDDLVLNGKDIQPGNTPIGLGNVNVTLGGDLRISKRPAGPVRIIGQVNAVHGMYEFQGRRFDIRRGGLVRFDGFVPINPSLDITATRLISGVETRVRVGGTMRKPELTLSSNPPLEQSDILSLIIFNQPANELGAGQQVSLAQRASALATGFVANKLADSIGKALNLDVFEIQTEATPGGGQGATLTVGEQVGRNLYFKLVQGVGSDTTSQFVLDYDLAKLFRLETTVSQGTSTVRTLTHREQSGIDLIFFFSY